MSPGESRSLNKERLRQRNEAPRGAGYQSREAYPSGSHTPDECQIVGMVKIFESVIKDRYSEQAEVATTLEPKGNGGRNSAWSMRFRDPSASRSRAGT